MKKRKKRHSGVGSIYVLIALMIVTAVFTGGILGWLIWYGISGGRVKTQGDRSPSHRGQHTAGDGRPGGMMKNYCPTVRFQAPISS